VGFIILPPGHNFTAGLRTQEGGRLGWCFDVVVPQNEAGAKLSGIQEWHLAVVGWVQAKEARCCCSAPPAPSLPGSFGHLSGN